MRVLTRSMYMSSMKMNNISQLFLSLTSIDHMPLFKGLKSKKKQETSNQVFNLIVRNDDRQVAQIVGRLEDETPEDEGAKVVYFTLNDPNEALSETLRRLSKNSAQIFSVEDECLEYIKTINHKVFLILDNPSTAEFIEKLEAMKDLDSVFIYFPTNDCTRLFSEKQRPYLVYWCDSVESLVEAIKRSREEVTQHAKAFNMYNKKEKATRDLSKESGSFLFFQLFKMVMKSMPKTEDAKRLMITRCRDYYRGNTKELANIEEFDKTYKAEEAIPWYTKETFVYKFINKALRTEDVDVLYQFRFYIMDLSEQLEKKFQQLKETQKDILRLYRGLKLGKDEIEGVQQSIGNLISTNGYLSTSSERSVAYGFATKPAKRDNIVRALFEYQVDLNMVKKIVIADIREYSAFPEEAEVLVDIGASFQIDSCIYDPKDNLWHITAHATDQGADLAAEYIEYQKKKLDEADVTLMFGNLLLEMGEYKKAENYFDTLLTTSKPNDEAIACIYFNVGRTNRLNGDFNRALEYYNRALHLHVTARPKRSASAGKTLNGLGVVYSELGRQIKAEDCFLQAMKYYSKSVKKNHFDVGGTLINLGVIDCQREEYDKAAAKFEKAKKIYDHSLPPGHPSRALLRMNVGNVYRAAERYQDAMEEYENALEIQEKYLPADHSDIVRTLNNLSITYASLGNQQKSKEYFDRADDIVQRTLSNRHPLSHIVNKTKTIIPEVTIEIPDDEAAKPLKEIDDVVKPAEIPTNESNVETMEVVIPEGRIEQEPEVILPKKEKQHRKKKRIHNDDDHLVSSDTQDLTWIVSQGDEGEELFLCRC